MTDISNRKDIESLIEYFYSLAIKDQIIGHFFNSVVTLNWEVHIPKICDFWETVLFGSLNYKGNPMTVHMDLNKKSNISELHFSRWLELWNNAIDHKFIGSKAEEAKLRAKSIAGLMKFKIDQTK